MTSNEKHTIELARRLRLYETILSKTLDLVYVFDVNYRILYANDALLALLRQDWEAAAGKSWLELGCPRKEAEGLDGDVRRAVRKKKPVSGVGSFGSRDRIFEYVLIPVIDDCGEVEAVAGSARDVTATKRAEHELREAGRRREEFITLLAHELRNPLAPLVNGLQLIKLAAGDEATLAAVRNMMERQLSQLVRLIDDLLDVSRLTRSALSIQRESVLLSDVVAPAIEAVRPLIQKRGHKLVVSLPAEPITLDADRTRLSQVLLNLLTNSAKYMEEGGVIRLVAESRSDGVEIAVVDEGIGITPEELPAVFDMFVRADRAIEKDREGLGVGLALSKGLVEMHGGALRAESDGLGKGSRFVVTLPRLPADTGAIPRVDPPVQLQSGVDFAARRVLVIDDNDDVAASMALMLKALGHDVRIASDGPEGLRIGERYRPDVIFMDIGMPRLDGLEATQRLRKEPWVKNATMVALTGWGREDDKSKLAGCDHHLVKPVRLDDLAKLLRGVESRTR